MKNNHANNLVIIQNNHNQWIFYLTNWNKLFVFNILFI